MILIGIGYSVFITVLFVVTAVINSKLKKQIKLKCKKKYLVLDKNSNAVPCYIVYECEHCKYKE